MRQEKAETEKIREMRVEEKSSGEKSSEEKESDWTQRMAQSGTSAQASEVQKTAEKSALETEQTSGD